MYHIFSEPHQEASAQAHPEAVLVNTCHSVHQLGTTHIVSILSYTAFLEGATVVTQFHPLQYAVSDILEAVKVQVQVVYPAGLVEL